MQPLRPNRAREHRHTIDPRAALTCRACKNAGRDAMAIVYAGRTRVFRVSADAAPEPQYRVKCATCGREFWTLVAPADAPPIDPSRYASDRPTDQPTNTHPHEVEATP